VLSIGRVDRAPPYKKDVPDNDDNLGEFFLEAKFETDNNHYTLEFHYLRDSCDTLGQKTLKGQGKKNVT